MAHIHPSPNTVFENLKKLDQADVFQSAEYRQNAVEVLADLDIDVEVRQEIANRLDDANHLMTLRNVDSEDSY